MTRDEILAAGDPDALRDAIKAKTGEAPVGRRTIEGLRVLAARAYGIDLNEVTPDAGAPAAAAQASEASSGELVSGPLSLGGGTGAAAWDADSQLLLKQQTFSAAQAVRPQPIGEIGALMSGGPVSAPVLVSSGGKISVRVLRDYWPREGERIAAGTVTTLPQAEAKPLVRDGVLEWI